MPAPVAVFDLDGTLIDTAPDLLASLRHCLALAGIEPDGTGSVRDHVGFGARVMLQRAFAARGQALDEAQLERLLAAFLEHYEASMPGDSRPFPGVLEAMDRLGAAGFTLAVCTNKYEGLSRKLLAGLGLSQRFAAICGADSFAWRKPDPRHLTGTIQAAGGDPAHGLMIGDSRTDIDTARAAGLPVIAVDFGYTDRHVSEFAPSRVISHFDELTVEMARTLLDGAGAASPRTADRD